jgi:hypothetical protein
MRITLSLPDQLIRQAKMVAVQQGITLSNLIERALSRELGISEEVPSVPKRTKFPIFSSLSPGALDLSQVDYQNLDLEEDIRSYGCGN